MEAVVARSVRTQLPLGHSEYPWPPEADSSVERQIGPLSRAVAKFLKS